MSLAQTCKKEIIDLIAKGELPKALAITKDCWEAEDYTTHNAIIALSAQWCLLEIAIIRGRISWEQERVAQLKLILNLLNIINKTN